MKLTSLEYRDLIARKPWLDPANAPVDSAFKVITGKPLPPETRNDAGKCLKCGVSLDGLRRFSIKRKYCSLRCAWASKERVAWEKPKDRGTAICANPNCKKVFTLRTNRGTKYCSSFCASSDVGKRTMANNRIRAPRTKYVKAKCPECGNEFQFWLSSKRIYCSTKCSGRPTAAKIWEIKQKKGSLTTKNTFSRAVRGWREIGGKRFFARSKWEANYAVYLEFLKNSNEIVNWFHEPLRFWFDGIKQGCRSYLPDFEVLTRDGTEYHEVKGWMTKRSKTALNRMRIYHPEIKMVVIDQDRYKAIARTMKAFPQWEN